MVVKFNQEYGASVILLNVISGGKDIVKIIQHCSKLVRSLVAALYHTVFIERLFWKFLENGEEKTCDKM